jgi:hypothetical protein
MKHFLVVIICVSVFGVSCKTIGTPKTKAINNSEFLESEAINLIIETSKKPVSTDVTEMKVKSTNVYSNYYKVTSKKRVNGFVVWSIVSLSGLVLSLSSEKGSPTATIGTLMTIFGFIPGFAVQNMEFNSSKKVKGKEFEKTVIFKNKSLQIEGKYYETDASGILDFGLNELGYNTGRNAYTNISISYKGKIIDYKVDTRQRNLGPSLKRLSKLTLQYKTEKNGQDNFISEYVDQEIEKLKSPKTEFETEAEYEARIASIETRKDEFKADAELEFLKTLEPIEKEIQRERNHIFDIIREPLKATFHAGGYSAEKEELQTRLVFETETPEFNIDYPISRARASNIIPQLRQKKPKADVWFNLTEEDDLVISKVELDFQGEQLVYQGKGKAAPSLPPRLVVSEPQFSDTDGDNRLSAEERSLINFTISNEGQGPATGVQVLGETESSIGGLGASIGTIEPGESKSISLTAIGRDDIETGEATIDLAINESAGFSADPIRMTIPTQAYQPPKFSLYDIGVEDNRGTGIIRPGEVVNITARILNEGKGKAEDVNARIEVGENIFLPSQPGRSSQSYNIGTLESGEWHDVTFSAFSNLEADSFPVSLEITESRGEYGLTKEDLGLEFEKQQRTLQELTVQANEMENNTGVAPFLTVDIAKDIPQAKQEKENAVAVIIGNRSYRGDVPDVAFALRDASLTRKYVEQALGFRPGNIIYMEDATLTDMRVVFGDENNPKGQLSDLVKKEESEVFVFYSGHGAPNVNTNDGYLMPVDGNASRLSFTGYSLNTLYKNLNKLEAKSVSVVIDACFSGAAGNGEMLIQQASPIGIRVNNPAATLKNGSVVTASSGSQIASWYPEKRHGLLTYFYLKGLKGEADLNKDGAISNGEMKIYLSDQNDGVPYYARRIHSRDQQPQVFGNDELIIK